MDIKDFLAKEKKVIDSALENFLPSDEKPKIITKAMRYSLFAGGKRLRPILTLTTYRAMGKKQINRILPAACAIEMIHTYSLIHDDLPAMDDDNFRRGKPACHKKFGEAIAILAGDALFAKSFEVLQKTKGSPETILQINREISSAVGVSGMIGGQVMDIISDYENKDKNLLKYIHTHKTGKLISSSMGIGAILADGGVNEISAIKHAGELLGLAFQIVDDILDIEGTKKRLGKSVSKDKSQKKLTYPAIYGLDKSRDETIRLLEQTKAIFHNEMKHRNTSKLEQIAEFIVKRVY